MTIRELYEKMGGNYDQAVRVMRSDKLIDKYVRKFLSSDLDVMLAEAGKTMDVLVQVNPEGEETKFGTSCSEAEKLVEEISAECPHINVKGLMCIAPFAEDPEEVRPVFAEMKALYDRIAVRPLERVDFRYLSMGMSGDFETAIEEGANVIRVGTAIFGTRNYRQEEK